MCHSETQSSADWGWTQQGDDVWPRCVADILDFKPTQLTQCRCNTDVEGANVMALVSLAQRCIALVARFSLDSTSGLCSV